MIFLWSLAFWCRFFLLVTFFYLFFFMRNIYLDFSLSVSLSTVHYLNSTSNDARQPNRYMYNIVHLWCMCSNERTKDKHYDFICKIIFSGIFALYFWSSFMYAHVWKSSINRRCTSDVLTKKKKINVSGFVVRKMFCGLSTTTPPPQTADEKWSTEPSKLQHLLIAILCM